MLHPLQLKEVSLRYAVDIAELRDYLGKAGIPVETPEAIGSVAARLRQGGSFRRDLTLHVWAISHTEGRLVSYADAMGILTVAAAGPAFAAEGADGDTRELLRFVMEARSFLDTSATSFDTRPDLEPQPPVPMPTPTAVAAVQPVHFVRIGADSPLEPVVDPEDYSVPSFETEEGNSHRLLLWSGIAACALLVLCFGLWLHHQPSSVSTTVATVPASSANPEAAQPSIPITPPSSTMRPSRHSRFTSAEATPSEPLHSRATVPTALTARDTSPRDTAPRNTAPSLSVASTVPAAESPISARPASKAPAASALSKADVHPDSTPQPITNAARSNAPVYRGSDVPLVVLHTPVVRPVTLGNMASHLTYGPAPQYPAAAVDQHVQGEVRLEAEVDRTGNVISTRIVSGPPLLQEAATNALQSWQYRPYLYAGKPIAVNATVVMDFQLQ